MECSRSVTQADMPHDPSSCSNHPYNSTSPPSLPPSLPSPTSPTLLASLKPRKDLPLRLRKLSLNSLGPLLPPHPDLAREVLRTHQEALAVARLVLRVDFLRARGQAERKGPDQLREREPQVALRDVDSGTEAAAGAVAVWGLMSAWMGSGEKGGGSE